MNTVCLKGIFILISGIICFSFDETNACCDVDYCIYERCKSELQETYGENQDLAERVSYIFLNKKKNHSSYNLVIQYYSEVYANVKPSDQTDNPTTYCNKKYHRDATKQNYCINTLKRYDITSDLKNSYTVIYNTLTIHDEIIAFDVKEYMIYMAGKLVISSQLKTEDLYCQVEHCKSVVFDEFGIHSTSMDCAKSILLYNKLDQMKSNFAKLYFEDVIEVIIPKNSMKNPVDFCTLKYTQDSQRTKDETATLITNCKNKINANGFEGMNMEEIFQNAFKMKVITELKDDDLRDYMIHISDHFSITRELTLVREFCNNMMKTTLAINN